MTHQIQSNHHQLIDDLVQEAHVFSAIRRDIHAHPELCFEENRTSNLVAEKLKQWNIPFERGLGKTGIVGIIKSGKGQRAIGLRADMDALPMQELNAFAHKSQHTGKMHACGHDGHTAMLLAAAYQLSKEAQKGSFDGTVYVIFQPAEEGGGGAREMIKDGLFEKFPMDAVYGMHNWPGMPVGTFAVSSGSVMASSNEFKITIHGKGCHAALPYMGIDPIPIACQLVQGFQTVITRNKKPIDAGVISVTMIHAGEATNVVPNTCELQGTVRTFSLDVLDLIEKRMREISQLTCQAFGASCEFSFERNYPPTINHEKETQIAREVMIALVGEKNVLHQEPTMGAEDFSYMLQVKSGAYFFVGNGSGDHRVQGHGEGPCTLHNASYDFNDDLIPLGATFWVRLVQRCLAK